MNKKDSKYSFTPLNITAIIFLFYYIFFTNGIHGTTGIERWVISTMLIFLVFCFPLLLVDSVLQLSIKSKRKLLIVELVILTIIISLLFYYKI
jgi:uncharacterized membrane protein